MGKKIYGSLWYCKILFSPLVVVVVVVAVGRMSFVNSLNTEKWLLVETQWNTNDCYINNWKIVSLKCSLSFLEKQYLLPFICYKIFKNYIKLIKSMSICIINQISGSHFYDLWA